MTRQNEWPQEITNETLRSGTYIITSEDWIDTGYQFLYLPEDGEQLMQAVGNAWPGEEVDDIIIVDVEVVRTTDGGLKLFEIDTSSDLHYLDPEDNHICDWMEG